MPTGFIALALWRHPHLAKQVGCALVKIGVRSSFGFHAAKMSHGYPVETRSSAIRCSRIGQNSRNPLSRNTIPERRTRRRSLGGHKLIMSFGDTLPAVSSEDVRSVRYRHGPLGVVSQSQAWN